MSIQHQRVVELCTELRLGGVAAQYTALAQKAAEKHTSFTDFVEELLSAERESRRAGHFVHPLPFTHPSLFGMEILVLGNAGEIMA